MDPVLIATLAINVLHDAMSAIQSGVRAGKISVELQKTLHAKIDVIRRGDFSGPEWQVEAPPPLTVVADAAKPDV